MKFYDVSLEFRIKYQIDGELAKDLWHQLGIVENNLEKAEKAIAKNRDAEKVFKSSVYI